MGKGDTRTRRGKTNNHSYGKKRPRNPPKPGQRQPAQGRRG